MTSHDNIGDDEYLDADGVFWTPASCGWSNDRRSPGCCSVFEVVTREAANP